jgi:ribosomal subunit interface protein
MIERIEVNGIHTEVHEDLQKYILKKIGKLDSYMPRHARDSAHVEVKLKEHKVKDKNNYTCEVIIHVPGEVLATKETTLNMFAAVDIVEAKLKNLLKKYKDMHDAGKLHRRVLAKFRQKGSEQAQNV